MSGAGEYEDHAATTVAVLAERFPAFLADRGVAVDRPTTVGAVWDAFLAFAVERVTHRGAGIPHEFVQVEVTGTEFALGRHITLEDDEEDYEGEAICGISFDVPDAPTPTEGLPDVPLTGPAGDLHHHGDGGEHEYQSLAELTAVVLASSVGELLDSGATVTWVGVSGG